MSYQPPGHDPDGYQPDGYQPEAGPAAPTPSSAQTVRLNGPGIIYRHPAEQQSYRISLDDAPDDATIDSVELPAGQGLTLTLVGLDNTSSPRSFILAIAGGAHGNMHQCIARVLMSSGTLVGAVAVRTLNG